MAKDGIQGDWSDVEELEPHAKTGMANVQVRVRCTTAVVGQCKQLFGEELENWRGLFGCKIVNKIIDKITKTFLKKSFSSRNSDVAKVK